MLQRVSARRFTIVLVLILLASCRQAVTTEPAGSLTAASSAPQPSAAAAVPPVTATPVPVPRITPEDVWQRLQGGEAITIIDARSLGEYQMEHIVGAISMPSAEVPQRWSELPQDSLLVFYCT